MQEYEGKIHGEARHIVALNNSVDYNSSILESVTNGCKIHTRHLDTELTNGTVGYYIGMKQSLKRQNARPGLRPRDSLRSGSTQLSRILGSKPRAGLLELYEKKILIIHLQLRPHRAKTL